MIAIDPVALIVGISWILGGLLIIGASLPLVGRKVRPNSVYGIRLRQSYESNTAWYLINQFGGRQFIGWSIPMIVVGVVSLFLPLQANVALTLILGCAPLVFLIIPAMSTLRFASGLERESEEITTRTNEHIEKCGQPTDEW